VHIGFKPPGWPPENNRVKKVNVALASTPVAGWGLLFLWIWLNSSERTLVLTRMERRKITDEFDSNTGDLGFKTDLFCDSE